MNWTPRLAMDSMRPHPDEALLAKLAQRAFDRCDQAASCTETPGQITRTFCSPAIAQLHCQLSAWSTQAGLDSHIDAAGNWWTRLNSSGSPDSPALIIGSHLDTVPNGGKYDGLLGVLLGLTLVEALVESKSMLPFAVEVVGFSEEEGVRFGTPFIGSRAIIRDCDETLLSRPDANGISVRAALKSFGCDVETISSAARRRAQVLAYLEPHIEQGPLLQSESLPLGVVTAIAGQTRAIVQFKGVAGHAGTVPMYLRRDALATAAEWILAVETLARETPGLVATVGAIQALPGAGNVIPGEVQAKLDVRHADDNVRIAAVAKMRTSAGEIAARRNIACELSIVHEHAAVAMDAALINMLEQSLQDSSVRPLHLVSGAGHDAAVLARSFPTAMLFIRCRDGISHHPDEAVTVDDVTAALAAMWHFVQRLAQMHSNQQGSKQVLG